MPFLFVSLLLSLNFYFTNAFAESTCGQNQLAKGQSYKWCVHTNPNSQDLLHYMHVSGGNVNSWIKQNTNIKLRELWAEQKKEVPNVITISFGGQWLMTDLGKYQQYVNEIAPYLESKITTFISRRILLGDSMGGFNAGQLLLKNGGLFERAAINCPAITSVGPWASDDEIEAFIERNKPYISRLKVWAMLRWGKQEFPSVEDWNRHDSVTLGKSVQTIPPHLYISCGDQDEFGFIEGSRVLAETLKNRGFEVIWNPTSGGHCRIDVKSVAKFLVP